MISLFISRSRRLPMMPLSFRSMSPRPLALSAALLSLWCAPLRAQTPVNLVIDDFEKGVGAWTANDKFLAADPNATASLSGVIGIVPDSVPPALKSSRGVALMTFKSGQDAWASLSRRVDGKKWAQIGATTLKFYLNAGGEKEGVDLVLRGRTKQADGSFRDEAFRLPLNADKKPTPVRLDLPGWREVAIPLSGFTDANGPILGRLNGVYLLQFVQSGTWDSRFFTIDNLRVEGSGQPIPQVVVAPKPSAPATPQTPAALDAGADAIKVDVDFLKTSGRIRPSANIALPAPLQNASGNARDPLLSSADFRRAVQTLHPRFVRLDAGTLSDLTDSSRPAFDYTRLVRAVSQVRAVGSEPLIAVTNPSDWGLDATGYAIFASGAARALNTGTRPVRYWELATGMGDLDASEAISFYNAARAALLATAAKTATKPAIALRIGGIGSSSGQSATLRALINGASGLDFLSIQEFGAFAGEPTTASLFERARDGKNLRAAAALLDASKFKSAAIYITGANINAARADEGAALDGRSVQMVAAAWWVTFLGSSSRVVDQVFHNDAVNPEWGFLDPESNPAYGAYPAYYAMYLWNTFVPSGSVRAQANVSRAQVFALAANTPTAHNVLLANTSDAEQTVRLSIRGFPVLRAARLRIFDDPANSIQPKDLPKSPFQTILLKPYAVAVVQFTEPPRKGKR